MNCCEAEKLMMAYMDGSLSEEQAEKLNSHVRHCTVCAETFQIYDSLLTYFDEKREAEKIFAPVGFEAKVMERLKNEQMVILTSPIKRLILIAFSILWLIAWGMIFFGRVFAELCAGIPLLSDYLENMVVIQEKIYGQGLPGLTIINTMFAQLNDWLSQSTIMIAAVLVGLCFLQAFLVMKKHMLRNKR